MNVLLFYLDVSLNKGYYILIYGFIHVTFNFVFVFDYTLSIFYFFLLFIFILLNEQKNEARKLTELASLKHRENFIAFQ